MSTKAKTKSILQPQEALPVACEELIRTAEIINQAFTGRLPALDPGNYRLNLELADGKVRQLQFTDQPFNRAVFVIQTSFPEDGRWQSLLYRFFALWAAIQAWPVELEPWLLSAARATFIDRPVMEAAAVVPVTRNVTFRRKLFLDKVAAFQAQFDDEA